MNLSRRDLLRLGSSSLLACGASVPLFLARTACAAAPAAQSQGRVLVVIQLDGGNDGLNTVVPFKDDDYRKARPRLQIAEKAVLKIDDRVGFHPSLAGFGRLLQGRQLAVVQSVGYPNPSRSHFDSMATWHSAKLNARGDDPGWLARVLDATPAGPGGDVPAIHMSSEAQPQPQALSGGQRHVPSLASLEQFRRRLGVSESAGAGPQRAALDQLAARDHGRPGSLLNFVERSAALSYASSARLEKVSAGPGGDYAAFGLARRLRVIAQLIKAGLTTSIYYAQLGNFDTHSNQANAHAGLLFELGTSLEAFIGDLVKSGAGERVVVLVFSEFGRRLAENGSAGTDHGTAAPVFLAGPAVRAGLHGPHPDLRDLADGDPKFAIDFRRVYATLLGGWLGCPSEKVLGGKFTGLALLGKR
jgi:uncharacterized protein (DUF1501 family)